MPSLPQTRVAILSIPKIYNQDVHEIYKKPKQGPQVNMYNNWKGKLSIALIQHCSNATCIIRLTATDILHIYGRGKQTTKENKERDISYKLSRVKQRCIWCQHVCKFVCPKQIQFKTFLCFDFKTFNYSCSYSILKPIFILTSSYLA